MASIEATRPPGIFWVPPASVTAVRKPLRFCTAPWLTITSAAMIDSGANTRTRDLVRSHQKLPIVRAAPDPDRLHALLPLLHATCCWLRRLAALRMRG
jgi:hypothetical protein